MEMCRDVQVDGILRFYLSEQKYFGTIIFCRMTQDVGKLRCRIAQVPLNYNYIDDAGFLKHFCMSSRTIRTYR